MKNFKLLIQVIQEAKMFSEENEYLDTDACNVCDKDKDNHPASIHQSKALSGENNLDEIDRHELPIAKPEFRVPMSKRHSHDPSKWGKKKGIINILKRKLHIDEDKNCSCITCEALQELSESFSNSEGDLVDKLNDLHKALHLQAQQHAMSTGASRTHESFYMTERVISIGLNPEHEKYREHHRQELHDMIHHSYKPIGGYVGHGSGTKEESKAIHDDISHQNIKAVRRNGKLTAAAMYKKSHGRKGIAAATNGTPQGKADLYKTWHEEKSREKRQLVKKVS